MIGLERGPVNVQDVEQGLAGAVQAVLDRLDGMEEPEVTELREDWAAVAEATALCGATARPSLHRRAAGVATPRHLCQDHFILAW